MITFVLLNQITNKMIKKRNYTNNKTIVSQIEQNNLNFDGYVFFDDDAYTKKIEIIRKKFYQKNCNINDFFQWCYVNDIELVKYARQTLSRRYPVAFKNYLKLFYQLDETF